MNQETEIKNAVITSAAIFSHDNGAMDVSLSLTFGGGLCQAFGGYALYLPKPFKHHHILSVAGHHIHRIMEVAGATRWSDLVGRNLRVDGGWDGIKRIGHIVEDDWYDPKTEFESALQGLNQLRAKDAPSHELP